jgi:hypothetical protein
MPRTKGAKNKPKFNEGDLEIKSLDTDTGKSKVLKNNYYDLKVIPNHASKVMFCGGSGSGKTTLWINMLINPNYYGGYFHNIFVFSPNAYADEEFDSLRSYYEPDEEGPTEENRVEFFTDLDEAPLLITKIFEIQKNIVDEEGIERSPRLLIILDDFIGNKKLINSSILQDLFTQGRHNNISTWVSVQAFNACPLKCRKQLNNLIIFRSPDEAEVDCIMKEFKHKDISKEKFKEIFDDCTKDPYSFLHIVLGLKGDDDKKMYRKKFFEIKRIL